MSLDDFEAVWNALPIPAFLVADNGDIARINPAGESLVGLSDRQVAGRSLERFAGVGSRLGDVVVQARERGVSVVQYDVECGWQDRHFRLGTLQANPVGHAGGAVLVLMNPRGLAEKIDRSFDARSAARSVRGMAAMLAHEIRNPLAGIAGAAQLLSMQSDDEDNELTDLIESEAARIGELVSRVEQFGGMGPLVREPVNIYDVLHRAVVAARSGYAAHARIKEDYDPSLPATAGDPHQLMQVFQNILKNAAEAIPPVGGTILVKTAYRPGIRLTMPGGSGVALPLEVVIIDNGGGISQDLIGDIFDPFVTTKVNGTGLGLSLVSKVLADHGGAIDCESEEGRTIFTLRLPVWGAGQGTGTGAQ